MTLLGFGPAELLAITVIMAAATIVQMAIGVGLSLVMIPLLALISPNLVPAPAIFAAFAVMLAMIWGKTRLIDRGEIAWGAGGLAVGTAVGVTALGFVDPVHLPRIFGVLILIAAGLSLGGLKLALSARNIMVTSLISGLTGGLSGIHGPLIGIVYAGEEPAKIRATLGLYWIVAYALLIGMYVAAGRFGLGDLGRAGLLLPGIAIGAMLTPHLVSRIDRRRMRLTMLAVAVASAVMLIVRG